MAGYDYSAGMSNNAVAAYDGGLVPASKIGGVPKCLIERFCRYSEWHHSSKFFNRVPFYDPDYVRGTFGLIDPDNANPDAVAALAQYKIDRREAKKGASEAFHDATKIAWTEFDKGRRGCWVPREESFTGLVRVRGAMIDMLTPHGIVTKKSTGRNIRVDLGKAVTVRTWTMRSNKIERDREAAKAAAIIERDAAIERQVRHRDKEAARQIARLSRVPEPWQDPATPFPEGIDAVVARQVRLTRLLVVNPKPDRAAILFAAGLSSVPTIRPDGFPRDLFRTLAG